MYLTFEEYQALGGSLTESVFLDFEFEAEIIINWYTFDRLKNDTTFSEAVKRCTYKLIQMAKLKADALTVGNQVVVERDANGEIVKTVETGAAIASQSNDGVSVSYNTLSASEIFGKIMASGKGNGLEAVVSRYLHGVTNELGRRVLYRGVYPGE